MSKIGKEGLFRKSNILITFVGGKKISTVIIGLKVGPWYKSTCIRSLKIEGHATLEYQKIFTNALKTAYLNLSEYFDQEKIAQKIILLEMPLIQVEGFLNLK